MIEVVVEPVPTPPSPLSNSTHAEATAEIFEGEQSQARFGVGRCALIASWVTVRVATGMTAIGGLFGGSMQSCNVSNYEHHQDSLTLHQLGVSGGPLHGLMDYLVTAETPAQAGTKLTMFTFAAIYSILAWRRLGSDKPERLVDRT